MVRSSQSYPSPLWSGPDSCPFCQQQLDNGGAAFMRHIEMNERCHDGFERWRGNVSNDMKGEWSE